MLENVDKSPAEQAALDADALNMDLDIERLDYDKMDAALHGLLDRVTTAFPNPNVLRGLSDTDFESHLVRLAQADESQAQDSLAEQYSLTGDELNMIFKAARDGFNSATAIIEMVENTQRPGKPSRVQLDAAKVVAHIPPRTRSDFTAASVDGAPSDKMTPEEFEAWVTGTFTVFSPETETDIEVLRKHVLGVRALMKYVFADIIAVAGDDPSAQAASLLMLLASHVPIVDPAELDKSNNDIIETLNYLARGAAAEAING